VYRITENYNLWSEEISFFRLTGGWVGEQLVSARSTSGGRIALEELRGTKREIATISSSLSGCRTDRLLFRIDMKGNLKQSIIYYNTGLLFMNRQRCT
jgi:hypothetical protein